MFDTSSDDWLVLETTEYDGTMYVRLYYLKELEKPGLIRNMVRCVVVLLLEKSIF